MNHLEAKAIFGTAKVPESGKPFGNNTRLMKRDDCYAIKLHETDVITYHPDGTITLNSGGWRTVTTKARINEFTNADLGQRNGIWYMCDGSIFFDGIKIDSVGVPLNPKMPTDIEHYKKKVDKLVRDYINGFVDHVMKNGLEDRGEGDCWGCSMQDQDGNIDVITGISHYLSHFEEKYYVPSLLINAMIEMNYGNMQFMWEWMKNYEDIRKRTVSTALSHFFRNRKLALVEELMKNENR